MANRITNYFANPAAPSLGRRIACIVLSVLLFFSLALLGFLLGLRFTLFSPDYAASYVKDIDVSDSARAWLDENVPPEDQLTAEAAYLGITFFEPEIKDQLRGLVRHLHRFLMDNLLDTDLDAVAAQREAVIDVASDVTGVLDIPILQPLWESLGVSADALKFNIRTDQINSFFDIIEELADYQNLAAFAYRFYVPSILIVLALIAAIVFTARNYRLISSFLGITLAAYGIIELVTLLPVISYLRTFLRRLELQDAIHDVSLGFIGDFNLILNIFGAVILFSGIMFIVSHYLVKSRKTA